MSTPTSPREAAAGDPGEPDPIYARLATDAQLETAAAHLRERGFEALIVPTAEDARREVLSRVPSGSEVFDGTSRTLAEAGIVEALTARSDVTMLRPRALALDRKTQMVEFRRITQVPGVIVGSVHAITEAGEVLVASATGGQLGPYAFGAGRVIWVVGAQKVVPTFADGMDRIERYSFPLEDARARVAYGVGSSINRILILRRDYPPGRTTAILVKQKLGF
jgi:L-lactate utilization protein LutC